MAADPSADILPPDAVFAACPSGPASGAWRTILESGSGPIESPGVRPGQALAIWVGDLLRREVPRYVDGVTVWVSTNGIPEAAWAAVAYSSAADGPPPVLSITDGVLAGAHGALGPFDLSAGKPADKDAGRDWFKVDVFNLRTLYQLCRARAENWIREQQKSGPTPTPPPSVYSHSV